MDTKHFTKLMTLVAIIAASLSANAMGQTFRGIPIPTNGNSISSPTSYAPMYSDFTDSFARDGLLGNTVVDGFRTGYVPPYEFDAKGNSVPDGPLTGETARLAGRWMPIDGSEYVTSSLNGGFVQRASDEGRAVACLPWRVYPELGQGYLLEMSAVVAEGETVSLAYFGDVNAFGADNGLDGQLGQLVLGISRGLEAEGTEDQLSWSIAWDDNGSRQEFSGTSIASMLGEEVRMQLRWDDLRNSGNDLFDAWIETSNGNQRLLEGQMGTEIDVFGAGFEISGTDSRITGFVSAVPEPSSILTGLFGLLLLGMRFRRP